MAQRMVLNPFRLPRGPLGRLAGWVMARRTDQHRELLDWLDPPRAARWCEIGFGPGQLIELLCRRDPDNLVLGVDPSPVMVEQAQRRNAAAVAAGRVDLRHAGAEALPFPDRLVDYVVAVNSVAMWPDLEAGLAEALRVLVPGGLLMVAWHGATSPNPIQRRLARPEAWWADAERRLRTVFGTANRQNLVYSTVCTARRSLT
jgi:ubiquinone/menaquinone biosynthesis C-methylase UbiE